jgi:hypothetical protein
MPGDTEDPTAAFERIHHLPNLLHSPLETFKKYVDELRLTHKWNN